MSARDTERARYEQLVESAYNVDGVPEEPVSSASPMVAAAATSPIGAAFDPDWLLGTNTFLPWHARTIRRLWVPRVVGRVSNAGSSPEAFEPTAGWQPFGAPQETTAGVALAQWSNEPRLAFIDGWGSGNNKLFGTYVVTHQRKQGFITYVACRKIVPSSDHNENPDGVSDVIFEELERNVHWIPAAVGSVDLSGDEMAIFMHFNDNGDYRTELLTAGVIDRWQQQLLTLRSLSAPGAADADGETLAREEAQKAQRRYWQVVLAVKNAAKSDERYFKQTQAVPQLKTLWNQGGAVPDEDVAIYEPNFTKVRRRPDPRALEPPLM